jgi:hypothetical protein
MQEHETAVVYVVSPNREEQLFRSLSSLLTSGSHFDTVRIYCVGPRPGHWRFADPRVLVEVVRPLFGQYFFGNKIYLCDSPARRVIFLDSDTVVLRRLDTLWKNRGEHVLGRRGTSMSCPDWNSTIWRSVFATLGLEEVPMFNAGVLVFQDEAHAKLKRSWQTMLERFLSGDLPAPWPGKRMSEQWALSVALAKERLSFAELGSKEHAYGWQRESSDGAAVFHYGNHLFSQVHAQFDPLPEGLLEQTR